MRLPASARWIGLALLGLVIAAAVAIAASNLASQQIGIASESITAGDRLAPAVRSAGRPAAAQPAHRGHPHQATTTTESTTATPPPETSTTPSTTATPPPVTTPSQSAEPGDDHSGGGHGADD